VTVIYIVLPLALVIAIGAVLAYRWSVRSGQMDDLETPATRMLQDDMPRRRPRSSGSAEDGGRASASPSSRRDDESAG